MSPLTSPVQAIASTASPAALTICSACRGAGPRNSSDTTA